jgi:UDP-N-acetylmuramoyl-tripeptide--D-alanyl-D-alanine ligase
MATNIQQVYACYEKAGFTVSTDTRKIAPGSLFFALKGDNFNGNLFAEKALELGALYAIVDEKTTENDRLLLVDDALKCLQELAMTHRRKLGINILGIGGSNGKTTTKELVVSVLSTKYRVHATQGNLNNHIGVPLTLLQLRPEHEIAVVELGANKGGDIDELCRIAEPDLGIITNIGKEHLEGFGGMEGVSKAEGELFVYLRQHQGYAFVNMDDVWIRPMGESLEHKKNYGSGYSEISSSVTEPGIIAEYRGVRIESVLMGQHNLQNIMAAVCIAEYFDVPAADIKKGIESYHPKNNRSQLLKTDHGNVVLLDAYNANPSSVEMALNSLERMEGERIALLGDMFELGAYEASEHQSVAEMAVRMNIHHVLLVGQAFSQVNIKENETTKKFISKEDAMDFIRNSAFKNCTILIKGSRGMKMEDFLGAF